MSDDDDLPVGRILSRRAAMRLLAAGGAGVLIGWRRRPGLEGALGDSAATSSGLMASAANGMLPACVAQPELTVGPYFVDKQLERSDIRVEPRTGVPKAGSLLDLRFNVHQIANGQCTPLAGAMVDVWQCDADGVYSGVNDPMLGTNAIGQKFLRGYQVTDAAGAARFVTIYPGWYRGRTVHVHFKIRTPLAKALADDASAYEFTSQLFFDDALTDRVYTQQPYAAKGRRDTRNANDGIFREGGDTLVLRVAQSTTGYAAAFDIGLDLSDVQTGRPDRSGGRGRGGPGGRRGGPPPTS